MKYKGFHPMHGGTDTYLVNNKPIEGIWVEGYADASTEISGSMFIMLSEKTHKSTMVYTSSLIPCIPLDKH